MSRYSADRAGLKNFSKKVLVIQRFFTSSGGANLVAANVVEALKDDYAVSVLTWKPVDLHAVNRAFGTSLNESEFQVRLPPYVLRGIIRFPDLLLSVSSGILLRLCKKIGNNYDVLISLSNEADLGCPGIQYVHNPPYSPSYPAYRGRFVNMLTDSLLGGRSRLWAILAGCSYERMKTNRTLVNSDWSGMRLKEIYGIESQRIYPPVLGYFADIPWSERENGFVCIGRISREKNFEKIIRIVSLVRKALPDAHLHIIGTSTRDYGYRKRLAHVIQDSAWITLSENISRDTLVRLVSTHRYGIHSAVEPFGLAVAEMVRCGCIVFVPKQGGASEIVGEDGRLVYDTVEEAVNNIVSVMRSSYQQTSLRRLMHSRRSLFTQERFKHEIREVVREFSNRTDGGHENTKGLFGNSTRRRTLDTHSGGNSLCIMGRSIPSRLRQRHAM